MDNEIYLSADELLQVLGCSMSEEQKNLLKLITDAKAEKMAQAAAEEEAKRNAADNALTEQFNRKRMEGVFPAKQK